MVGARLEFRLGLVRLKARSMGRARARVMIGVLVGVSGWGSGSVKARRPMRVERVG